MHVKQRVRHRRRCTKTYSVRKLVNARVRNFYTYEISATTVFSVLFGTHLHPHPHTHTHTPTHPCTHPHHTSTHTLTPTVRELFLLFILFLCTCGYDSVRACRGGYFEMFDIRGGHFGVFDSQRHFPLLLLSSFSLLLLFFPLCTGPGTHCHP